MKALAITHKGAEEIASKEINELVNSKPKIEETCVTFEVGSLEDLALVCYMSQSIKRVLLLLDSFSFSSEEDLIQKAKKISFDSIKTGTFAVRCERHGNHPFSSQDIEKETGAIIFHKKDLKVDLENPETVVYMYLIEDMAYVGIDLCGFDMSKRQYKIFTTSSAIKGTTAYILSRMADVNSSHVIIDPFCTTSTIPIELTLFFSGFSVNYFNKDKFLFNNLLDFDFDSIDKKAKKDKFDVIGYDSQLRYIKSSQKNAKIAGIEKQFTISKLEVEWLDTKHEKNSVDRIISFPTTPSRVFSLKEAKKLMKELFYQARFVLKDKGTITLLAQQCGYMLDVAKSEGFLLKEKKELWQGKQKFDVVILYLNPKPL